MLLQRSTGALRDSTPLGPRSTPCNIQCVRAKPRCSQQLKAGISAAKNLVQCRYYTTDYAHDTAQSSQYWDSDSDSDADEAEPDDDKDEPLEVHHVHSRLPVHSVALGDDFTYVVLYEDGDDAWSAGLSDGLHSELQKSLRYKKTLAAVALGRNEGSDSYSSPSDPDEVWFLMRGTGTTYMGSACEAELTDCWWNGEGDDRVVNVKFAPNGGWFVFKKGGGARWSGLPKSLHEDLEQEWDAQGGVHCISIGHNGEWFVRYKSGVYAWAGVHPTLDRLLRTNKVGGRDISVEWVELGPDGTFVAVFDNHTVWYGSQDLTEQLLDAL